MSDESTAGQPAPLIVLLVEDDALIQSLLGPALEEAGFAVVLASSGEEALSLLGRYHPRSVRAVVCDVELGGQASGWDVCRRARELHPEIPVVYITGGRADEWSANGVPNSLLVTKPFAPVQIVTAVAHLLNAPNQAVSPPE